MGKASTKKKTATPGGTNDRVSGAVGDTPFFRGLAGTPVFHLFLIIGVGLIAYSNTFTGSFHFDDTWNIVDNPLIRKVGNFIASPEGYQFNSRRYIGYLTFALNYHFGKLDASGYHAVNLAIHITNAILVYILVALTFKTPHFLPQGEAHSAKRIAHRAPFIALFSALLFVSHPVQTQAVTYIVQRFTSLATMFYLLSVVMYIKGRLGAMGNGQEASSALSSSSVPIAHRLLPIASFCLSLLSAVLAMRTKEIAFTLPFVILLYEFMFFKTSLRKKLLFLIPVLLTLMIIPLSMIGAGKPLGELLSDLSEQTRVQTDISRWDYLFTQMRVIVTYIRLILFPVDQNLDYDYPIYRSFFTPPVLLSFLFLLSLLGLACYLLYRSRSGNGQWATGNSQDAELPHGAKRVEQSANDKEQRAEQSKGDLLPYALCLMPHAHYRLIAFGVFWFFIALSVESSFIPIADVIFEHRLYLPSVGALVAIVAGGSMVIASLTAAAARTLFLVIFSLGVLVLSSTTYARNIVWQTETALWEDVVKKSPRKARPLNNLGYIYCSAGRYEEALAVLKRAIGSNPSFVDAYTNLGLTFIGLNNFEEAIAALTKALSLNPRFVPAYNNLGISYTETKRFDEAREALHKALSLNPRYAKAWNNLGLLSVKVGNFNDAEKNFLQAIATDSDMTDAYGNLSSLYLETGDYEKAIAAANEVVRLNPRIPAAHDNLSSAYRKLGRYDDAVKAARRAIEMKPDSAAPYNNLGLAYLELKRYDDALAAFREALRLDPRFSDARTNLGRLHAALGNVPSAAEAPVAGSSSGEASARAHYDRGSLYLRGNQVEKAIEEFTKALSVDPKFADALNLLGIAYAQKNRLDRAIDSFNRAIALSPKMAGAYENRGIAHAQMKMTSKAIFDFSKAISLNPGNAETYKNRGVARLQSGDRQGAAVDFRTSCGKGNQEACVNLKDLSP